MDRVPRIGEGKAADRIIAPGKRGVAACRANGPSLHKVGDLKAQQIQCGGHDIDRRSHALVCARRYAGRADQEKQVNDVLIKRGITPPRTRSVVRPECPVRILDERALPHIGGKDTLPDWTLTLQRTNAQSVLSASILVEFWHERL